MRVLSDLGRRFFVLIVIGACVAGFYTPGSVSWVGWSTSLPYLGTVSGVMVGLAVIMFGMGITLSLRQVGNALAHPETIALGVAFQFLLMPLIAFSLVILADLEPIVGLGVILLGCCPGGTASNVMAFLAEADVPLSIAITLVGTLLAPVLTPWLFWFYGEKLLGFYLGETIDVPVFILAKATLIVVVPVMLGLVLKATFSLEETMEFLEDAFRLLSIIIIALVVAYIVSTVDLSVTGSTVVLGLALPVVLHNGFGLFAGYYASSFIGLSRDSIRTMTLEVGMQNSGLAMALAGLLENDLIRLAEFSPSEVSLLAVPAVLFSVWHNITGPLLASRWGSSRR